MNANPRDPLSYYELASHYLKNKDIANARKTLETLLVRNPAEIRGHLEIGRLEYAARNLKAAEKSLEKFLALTPSVRIEDRLRDEGRLSPFKRLAPRRRQKNGQTFRPIR